MRYIDQWLSGLGLDHIIPQLQQLGITTPKKMAQLSLRDIYEVVGVEDPEDRKKLYYLVQRLQTILKKEGHSAGDGETAESVESPPAQPPTQSTPPTKSQAPPRMVHVSPVRTPEQEVAVEPLDEVARASLSRSSDDGIADLKVLRREKRRSSGKVDEAAAPSVGNAMISSIRKTPLESSSSGPPPLQIDKKPSFNGAAAQPPVYQALRRQTSNMSQQAFLRAASPITSPPASPAEEHDKRGGFDTRKSKFSHSIKNLLSEASPPPSPPAPPAPPKQMPLVDDMPIRVVVRKRPLSRQEIQRGDRDILEIGPPSVIVHEPKIKVDLTKYTESQEFIFDDSFDIHETNERIYERCIHPLIGTVFTGGKASCFAYGQTGSGKTFTMMGSDPQNPTAATTNPGLYVLAARDIFRNLRNHPLGSSMRVMLSCFEIYGGKLFDLMNDRAVVKCLEDAKQKVQIVGLSEHPVRDVNAILEAMTRAHELRSTGSTGANMESSRSHQVLQIQIQVDSVGANKKKVSRPYGKLSFIDLAGSERGADTTHNNKQTRMEGAEINTSLLALKEVIRSLERKHGHTPFRGSKLTQVLKDSFVGDKSRTCMIACVSPSHTNCEHTLNTLRYADRVKEHQSSNNSNDVSAVSSSVATNASSANNSRPATAVNVPTSTEFTNNKSKRSSLAGGMERPDSAPPGSAIGGYRRLSAPPPPPPQVPAPATRPASSRMAPPTSAETSASQAQVADKVQSRIPAPARNSPKAQQTKKIDVSKTNEGAVQKSSSIPKPSPRSTPQHKQHAAEISELSRQVQADPNVFAYDDGSKSQNLGNSTSLLQRTVQLLSAHKLAIAEMVEVMKEEMELVQEMEQAEERNSEQYAEQLHQLLAAKNESIGALRQELRQFQAFREKHA